MARTPAPRFHALVLAGLLAACAVPITPPVDTARLPNNVPWVMGDPDMWALNQAQWAFADPGRTRNRPDEAARAVAALDYLAGQVNTSPRWVGMGPLAKMELLTARAETRAALGIAANAPSQVVVDSMMIAADALTVGNPHGAMAALYGPAYTRPPEQMLAVLAAMPYLPNANIATMHAAADLAGNGSPNPRHW